MISKVSDATNSSGSSSVSQCKGIHVMLRFGLLRTQLFTGKELLYVLCREPFPSSLGSFTSSKKSPPRHVSSALLISNICAASASAIVADITWMTRAFSLPLHFLFRIEPLFCRLAHLTDVNHGSIRSLPSFWLGRSNQKFKHFLSARFDCRTLK